LNSDFYDSSVLFLLGHDEDELIDRKFDEFQKLVSCGDANIFGKVTYFRFAMNLSYILFALVGFERVFSVMGAHSDGCCGFEHENVSKSSSMMCTFSSKLLQQYEEVLEKVCNMFLAKESIYDEVTNIWHGLEF